MNKLIACALLGLGLTQSLVACGDDDTTPDDGTAGGGAATAGKPSGGANQNAGSAGKATGGASGGRGGTPSAGTAGTAGTAGSGAAGEGFGGEPAMGGAGGMGAGGEGDMGGAGGAPVTEPQLATPYWLNSYCDAQSAEMLACESSQEWYLCFTTYYPFLSQGGDGSKVCANETDMEAYPLLLGTVEAVDALAAACPDTTSEDWRCTLEGRPQPKDKACRDAYTAALAALMACGPTNP